MNRGNFKNLIVWQKAMNICKRIYILSKHFPKEELYWLTNQIRRAAVSICSNIVEWNAKSSDKHFRVFLENALGSSLEIHTQYLIALELEYCNLKHDKGFENDLIEVTMILRWMIRNLHS